MMSPDRAIKIAEKFLPDRYFTGNGYMYHNNYYLEMAPKGTTGMPMDSMFIVDSTTATVDHYDITDGIINLSEIRPLR